MSAGPPPNLLSAATKEIRPGTAYKRKQNFMGPDEVIVLFCERGSPVVVHRCASRPLSPPPTTGPTPPTTTTTRKALLWSLAASRAYARPDAPADLSAPSVA